MLSHSVGDAIKTASYSHERKGLPGDITYVQQVAMPPNAWTKAPKEADGRADGYIADLSVTFYDDAQTQLWAEPGTMALPIARYSTKTTSGWLMNEHVKSLSVTVRREAAFGEPGEPVTQEIHLPADASILDVTASSSAAGGFVGSPALFRSQAWFPSGELAGNTMIKCLQRSLKELAVAQTGLADSETFLPTYRFIDGGFVENTALAATIGKVHADHPTDLHLGKFIHFDLDETFGENRVQALFTIPGETCNTQGQLCLDSDAPGQHNANNIGRPVSTIFADTWPEPSEWKPYTQFTDNDGVTTVSYYWTGTVTTIENHFYSVPAGLKLELLVFSLNHPPADAIIAGKNLMSGLWTKVYGPIATAQAEGATPVIRDFLA
jgi:hypothetical protein